MASAENPSYSKDALDQAFELGSKAGKNGADPNQDDYRVRTPVFEGPLDLLLHLIRKDQINIYDIPISKICQAYLEHIKMMQSPDVNLAGEFMVMAATLTFMKSLVLRPREEGENAEDDPRLPLVQQLLEYEKFKRAAEQVDQMDWMFRDIYPRPTTATTDIMPVEALLTAPLEPIDSFQLLVCLKTALSRTTKKPFVVQTDPISIKEKVVQMGELLESGDVVDFTRLLPAVDDRRPKDVVIAFFAMLELARLKYIEIIQHEIFGPIHIRGVRPIRDLNVGLLDQF